MKLKRTLVYSLALACAIYPSSVGYAASPYLSYGDENGRVSVNIKGSGSTYSWSSIVSESVSAWNNSRANVYINEKSTSKNSVVITDFPDSWYGLNRSISNSYGYITKYTIYVNGRTIVENARNVHSFIKSTITHEFGHVFWLCDNPVTGQESIMKHTRDRNSMTLPQQYDIQNVNKMYK